MVPFGSLVRYAVWHLLRRGSAMASVAFKHRRTGEAAPSSEGTCMRGSERPNDCPDMTTECHQDRALATGYAGPAVFAHRFHGLIACLLFAMSLPVFADCASLSQTCEQDLQREEKYNYQLAVCQKDGWHICEPNRTPSPHHLTVLSDAVNFFWAVPASEQREFIYASTLHTDKQHLSVWRPPVYEIPKLFQILSPFREIREDVLSQTYGDQESIRRSFLKYHVDPKHSEGHERNVLNAWHDTNIFGELRSYDLVRASLLRRLENPPLVAAERLLPLTERRPKTSWARIRSEFEEGEELHVTLAYSGSEMPRIWRFKFKVSRDAQVADENEQ